MPFSVNVNKVNALEKKVMEYSADLEQPRPVSNLLKQRPNATFEEEKNVLVSDLTRGFSPDGIRFLKEDDFDQGNGKSESEKLCEDVQSRLAFPTYSQSYSNIATYVNILLSTVGTQLLSQVGFFPLSDAEEKLTGGSVVRIKQQTLLTGFNYFNALIALSYRDSITLTGEISAYAEMLDDGAHYVSVRVSNQLLRALLEHDYESALYVYGLKILTANNQFNIANFKRAIVLANQENDQLQTNYQQAKQEWKIFIENDFPQNKLLHFIDYLVEAHHPEGDELISCPEENRYSKQYSCIQPVYSACIDTAMATAIYRDLPKVIRREKSLQECSELIAAIPWCGDPFLSYAMQACLIALENGFLEKPVFLEALNSEAFDKALRDEEFVKALSNESFLKILSKEPFVEALSNKALINDLSSSSERFLEILSSETFAKVLALSNKTFCEVLSNEAFGNALNNEAFISALNDICTAKMILEAELSKWKTRGKKSMYAYLQPQLQKAANTLTTKIFTELFSTKQNVDKQRKITDAVAQYNNTCRKIIKKIGRHDQQYAIKCGVLLGALSIAAVAIVAIVLPYVLTLPVDIFATGAIDAVLTTGIVASIGAYGAVAFARPRRKDHKELRNAVKEKVRALSETIENKVSGQLKLFFANQKAGSLEDASLEENGFIPSPRHPVGINDNQVRGEGRVRGNKVL